jgi:PAS domain S-box-containing protein
MDSDAASGLREENQRLSTRLAAVERVLECAADAILVFELPGRGARGTFEYANPAASSLLGYTAAEMARLCPIDLREAHELAEVPEEARLLLQERHLHRRQTYVTKDGRHVAVDSACSLLDEEGRTVAVCVLRRAHRGDELRGREQQWQEALEDLGGDDESSEDARPPGRREAARPGRELLAAIPHLVWTCDPAGRCDFVSPQWVSYTGRPAERLLGSGWLEALHPEDRQPTAAAWARAVGSGEGFDVRYRIADAHGSYRWFHTRAAALRDGAGRVTQWLGTNTDVDDLVRAEEALREADRRKDEFLAMLSHELRNPLAPIRNALFVLDRTVAGTEPALRARGILERQLTQLTRIVDDLLDVTRLSHNKIELQRQVLELNTLAQRALEDYRPLFESRGVTARFVPSAEAVLVHADAMRLAQAIGNLLHNAGKFTGQGGTVTLSVLPSGQDVCVRVADTGIGMPHRLLGRLFEPFRQGDTTIDRGRGGLGLGLAMVRGIVELHGGSTQARSDGEGLGSQIELRLPLSAAERPVAEAERVERRRRVLIVEDNHDAADSLREALELSGHEVAVAYAGEPGLECARGFAPDLVLCDIGLPGIDGYQVARALRADPKTRDARLVALTGYAQPDDVRRAFEAGFDHHLAKPPSIEKLASLLR